MGKAAMQARTKLRTPVKPEKAQKKGETIVVCGTNTLLEKFEEPRKPYKGERRKARRGEEAAGSPMVPASLRKVTFEFFTKSQRGGWPFGSSQGKGKKQKGEKRGSFLLGLSEVQVEDDLWEKTSNKRAILTDKKKSDDGCDLLGKGDTISARKKREIGMVE